MDPGSVILIVILILVLVVVGTVTAGGLLLYKGARGVARRAAPSAETVRRGVLRVQARAASGSRGELAGMRSTLADSLSATRRSLDIARESDQHTGNLAHIVQTLDEAGAIIDRQLAVAEKDPDASIQQLYAQTLGAQVEQILQTSTGVRQALATSTQPMAPVDLDELTRALSSEAKLLEHWARTYAQLRKR
ncbi:hypothetical protein IV498_01235 [Paenarthrobacter sp. Z7-10]|uniref:hypothetical protein n=1 Tax=Paenarthrobacter sp. Z7-10 TaxID=2787635 RepID=UPI0022A901BC|nr:hypothetical protein [Paenarthrobacter sp. Z7-10]MCZ2401839.1 hypothetical protein [Paenarthrobacter sp. Z7-10]